jgi:tetratricopeptide (TPR) repeat protein
MLKLLNRRGIIHGACLAVAGIIAISASGRRAAAQITTDSLIGQAVPNPGAPEFQDVADAIVRFQNQDINGARALLEKAKSKTAKLPPAEVMMARLLLAAGQLDAARNELERAVASSNTAADPEPYLIFAEIALRQGRATDAEALYLRAKPLVKDFKENAKRQRNFDMTVNAGLASVAAAREQWDAAIESLKAWLALEPEKDAASVAHQQLGRAYFKKGKEKEAYDEFKLAQSDDVDADVAMARMYEDAKNRTQATTFIEAAVKKHPDKIKVMLDATRWAMLANKIADAQKWADAAMNIDKNSVDAKVLRGQVARMTGDFAKAEQLLEQAHMAAPANLDAANQLAIALAEGDATKKQRAKDLAEANLKLSAQGNQFNSEAMVTYAWVLFKLGNLAEAQKVIVPVLQRGIFNSDSGYYLAKMLEDSQPEAASQIIDMTLKNSPSFTQRKNAEELQAKLSKMKSDKSDKPDKAPK